MGAEIERKYLVKNTLWKPKVETSIPITQGYITRRGNASVRVRLTDKNAFVTLKGARNGIQRAEYEYPIPREDAEEMLATLAHQPLVEKTRHLIPNGNHVWELDVFDGANKGLVTAEIELASTDEAFEIPEWVGDDVSDDPRYANANLVKNPFTTWDGVAPQK
jgi:adenylate cyclase